MSGVNAAVASKEWRENAWKLAIGGGVAGALAVLVPVAYDLLAPLLQGVELPGALGEAVKRQLGDFRTYLWINWYGKNLYQVLAVLAILLGMGTVAGEVSRRTSAFLLSRPLRRETVLRSKALVGLAGLAGVAAGSTAVLVAASALAGYPVDPAWFLAGLPLAVAGSWAVYALAVYASTMFDEPLKAGAAAFVVVLALGLPGWFRSTRVLSPFYHMKGLAVLEGAPAAWPGGLSLLLLAALVYLLAERRLADTDF